MAGLTRQSLGGSTVYRIGSETLGTTNICDRWPRLMVQQRITAIGLLTDDDLGRLGSEFKRAWPIDEAPCFSQLLQAIDEAERECWRQRDAATRE